MSLTHKAAHGIAWVALSTIIIRILGFATKIVLARLLEPADFGLVAIGLLVINSVGMFRDLGFGAALIYKKDDENYAAANTAFIILPIVATIIFALTYFAAPFAATFFDNSTVEPIIRIMALTLVIQSLGTVPTMLLEKELEFKKKVLPETLPKVGYAFVSISLALLGYGVWSIVYGQITSALMMLFLVWMVSDWRPTFKFDKTVALELMGYGKHVLGTGLLVFISTNIDDAFVGRLLSLEALGYYTLAFTISNLPATQITHLISRVMFPVYSKLQHDPEHLGQMYLKTLRNVSIITIPFTFGIIVIAHDFINIVIGAKWLPAVPVLCLLAISGLIRSIVATGGPLFLSVGRPDIDLKMNWYRLVVTVVTIYPAIIYFGLSGAAISVIFGIVATIPSWYCNISQIVNLKTSKLLSDMFLIIFGSVLMIILIKIVMLLFVDINSIKLLMTIIIGMVIYIAYLYGIYFMSKNAPSKEVVFTLNKIIRKIRWYIGGL